MRPFVAIGLATAALLAAAPSALAADELLARWHLDTSSGGFTPDDSGNALQGELNGGSALVDGGRFGKALDLDVAVDSQVDVLDNAKLEPAQVTVMAWVKLGSEPNGTHYVVAKGASNCDGSSYALATTAHGMAFHIWNGSARIVSPNAGTGIWNGQWHAVAGTFDGSKLRLFVDGAEVGSGSTSAAGIAYNTTSGDLRIGNYPLSNACGGGLVFEGLIDEARVYNRALEPFEIAHLSNASASTPPNLPAPPRNTAAPAITNAAAEPHPGDVLGRNPGTWDGSPTGYLEQWLRCGADGSGCADIAGATSDTYKLVDADAGKTIKVRVTAVNGGGNSAPVESGPTGVVKAGPPPPLVPKLSVTPNPTCTNVLTLFDASASTGPIVKYRLEYSEPDAFGGTNRVVVSEGTNAVSPPVYFQFNRVLTATIEGHDDKDDTVTTTYWRGVRDPAVAKVVLTSPSGATASATAPVDFASSDPNERAKCPKGLPQPWDYPLGQIAKDTVKHTPTTVSAKLPCKSASACQGGLSVTYSGSLKAAARRDPLVIGRKRFDIEAGKTKTVKAKLTRRGKKLLRARKRLRVGVVITVLAPDGRNVNRTRRVTLHAKAPRKRR